MRVNLELQLLLIKYGVSVADAELVAFRAAAIIDDDSEKQKLLQQPQPLIDIVCASGDSMPIYIMDQLHVRK